MIPKTIDSTLISVIFIFQPFSLPRLCLCRANFDIHIFTIHLNDHRKTLDPILISVVFNYFYILTSSYPPPFLMRVNLDIKCLESVTVHHSDPESCRLGTYVGRFRLYISSFFCIISSDNIMPVWHQLYFLHYIT